MDFVNKKFGIKKSIWIYIGGIEIQAAAKTLVKQLGLLTVLNKTKQKLV